MVGFLGQMSRWAREMEIATRVSERELDWAA
jgi:hypothetical protein